MAQLREARDNAESELAQTKRDAEPLKGAQKKFNDQLKTAAKNEEEKETKIRNLEAEITKKDSRVLFWEFSKH